MHTEKYYFVRTDKKVVDSMKKGNDKLTISVDESVKDKYKELCDSEGLKIGKQIELFMIEELKKRGKE